MSQKLSINYFKWVEYISESDENFIKSYNKETDEGSFLEVDVLYLEKLYDLHNYLSFLSERMTIVKVEKLIANLYDKTEDAIHIRKFKL